MTRKSSGQLDFSDIEVQTYLRKNKLSLLYFILNQSVTTVIGRNLLFKEKAQQYRNFILNYQTPKEIVTYDIVKMQLMSLDLLSDVFILLEDYLGHSYHLRQSLKNFDRQIASANFRVAENEINYLAKLRRTDIGSYLLLPEVSSFEFGSQ